MSANSSEDKVVSGGTETTKPAETPKEKLERLKGELDLLEAQNAVLDKKIDDHKGNIADLSKDVAEIEQRTKGWDTARKALLERKEKENAYYAHLRGRIEPVVRDKPLVLRKKKEGDDEIKELRKLVGELTQNEAKQTQELAAAAETAKKKKKDYQDLIDLAKRNDEWLKDIEGLEAQAEKEEEKNNLARMYFIILEMEEALKRLDIPEVDKYILRVNEAQAAASSAADSEQTAKEALAQTQSQLKTKRKALDDAEANAQASRRKKTLEAIPEGNPGPSPS